MVGSTITMQKGQSYHQFQEKAPSLKALLACLKADEGLKTASLYPRYTCN